MNKLIIKGGLGNQMFQYAAAYALSKKSNTPFVLDLSFMKNRLPIPGFTPREYELDLFGVSEETTTLLKLDLLDRYISYPVQKILMKLNLVSYYLESDPYAFDEEFFNVGSNAYIDGYFNNVNYFKDYSQDIKAIFDTDKLVDDKFLDTEKKISESTSVSINIRRGDYLNAKHSDIFVYLDETYYRKAIALIREKIENPHFFVFSYDDPEWFKEALQLKEGEYTYVGRDYTGERFKTYLRLISLCKHNIISNSTFAFWGAFLNKNEGKVVICPKEWTKNWSSFEVPVGWVALN